MIEETYKKIEETKDVNKRKDYWDIAIGLNKVDNLTPSTYFKQLVEENIQGTKTNEEVEYAIKEYYKEKKFRQEVNEGEHQCDMVSMRIKELLEDSAFTFSPVTLKNIHKYLFRDVFDFAGQFRNYNISKDEAILHGDSVKYANHFMIEDTLKYDFDEERSIDYSSMSLSEQIDRLMDFTSRVWQVHPFGEGNTRTTAVFIEKYLNSMGYPVSNDIFKEYSLYFRNALVRANYTNYNKKIYATNQYLRKFFENLLMKKNHALHNREMILGFQSKETE